MSHSPQIEQMDNGMVGELARLSSPSLGEDCEGGDGFAAAYATGVRRLTAAVETAAREQCDSIAGLSAGLSTGLEFLAADPPLAHLLLVEPLAVARPVRREHERSLARLADFLRQVPPRTDGGDALPPETARLLAGGLISCLSSRALAGEARGLLELHDLLLRYLLTSLTPPGRTHAQAVAGG